jgi:hypothetical protein
MTRRRKRGQREENVNEGIKKRRRNMGNEHRRRIRIKGWRKAKKNRYKEEKGNEREKEYEVESEE